MILGSKSQRRQDILSLFNLPFDVRVSHFDEKSVDFQGHGGDYVQTIAVEKAAPLAQEYPDQLILTADTAVIFQGRVLNKPQSYEEAFEMLQALNGNTHEVMTGVCVRKKDKVYSQHETTSVKFNALNESHLRQYIHSIDVLDRAGSYSIQGHGSLMVKEIKGCFYNVVGLPINTTQQLLLKMNVDLWQYATS